MKKIKNEMIKLFALSGAGLLVLLYISYKSVTYFIVDQEYQKAKLLAHTLVYTRDYLAQVAPYVEIKNRHFHPFSITPAYVVSQITTLIKKGEHFEIKQTSDRYRDLNNKPNKYDLEAINFFKRHPNTENYFSLKNIGNKEYLFYAYPLKMEKSCLKCHGPVKEIDPSLYEKLVKYYGNRAFGYKLGELRGIISIRLPFDEVKAKIDSLFTKLAVFLLVIYIIGVIVFLRINTLVLRDVEKINSFMRKNLSRHIFRPMKSKMIFYEFDLIKSQINDTVKSIKKYKKSSYENIYYNSLTKLPNRTKLLEVLKRKTANIIILDIDSFKEINYFYGEEIANELIVSVAKRIENYNPFHIKIDQFVILSPIKNKEEIKEFTFELIKRLEEPYVINGLSIFVKFRAGIAFKKKELKDAISALEATRFLNKDVVFDFETENIKELSQKHIEWIKKIKRAIKDDRIVPYFQPIVDKDTKVCKYEVLLRLIDEDGNVLTPYYFLDIAKKSRLYFDLTKIAVTKSFERFKNSGYEFSVNLTTMDMENEEIAEFILEKLRKYPEPQKVNFEIVENYDIKHSEKAYEFINKVKSLGCKILIDDFGSGYANFDYLLSLNADGIKIDGSLIKNILKDKNSRVIVKTIIMFAKEVQMQVIAEFVENEEIFEYLKNLGIDCYQGFFYSTAKKDV